MYFFRMNLWLLMLLFLLSLKLTNKMQNVPTLYQKIHSKYYKGQSSELRKKIVFFFFLSVFELNGYNVVLVYWSFIYCIHTVNTTYIVYMFMTNHWSDHFFFFYLCAFGRIDRVVHCYSVKSAYMNFFFIYFRIHLFIKFERERKNKLFACHAIWPSYQWSLSHIGQFLCWCHAWIINRSNVFVSFSFHFCLYKFINYYRC